MATQNAHPPQAQSNSIQWANTWLRTRADRNDDWHGFAAVTETQLILVQPKETTPTARGLQAQTHQILMRAAANGRSPEDYSKLEELIRRSGNVATIERSDIVAIQALAKGNLLRVRTTTGVHVVGGFSHKSEVTRVASHLAALLAPDAEPRVIARPKLSGDILRQLAVAPVTVTMFFLLAIGIRIVVGDGSSSVTSRGKQRLIEETLGAIPVVLLAAVALFTVAALIVRLTFRARDEVCWYL